MPEISLDHVSKFYKAERRLEKALLDVSITIKQGEFVFVVGSSGAGKSTLLKLLSGGERPSRGTVFMGGKDIWSIPSRVKQQSGMLIGQVWQEQTLMRQRTIRENLEMAARVGQSKRETARHIAQRVEKVLGLVGMPKVEDRYPVELSIGECRRVELARALINSPAILILDEITANLDDDSIWDMFQLLNELNDRGTSVIMATHARRYVNIMRRRVVTIVDGKIFGDVAKGKYGDIV